MNCENAIMSCENLIMNRENAIVNQLPSEIFLLQSVSFLIKLSCKKLPPSLVKCVFFCFNVPPSGQIVKRPFKVVGGVRDIFFHLENFRISRHL